MDPYIRRCHCSSFLKLQPCTGFSLKFGKKRACLCIGGGGVCSRWGSLSEHRPAREECIPARYCFFVVFCARSFLSRRSSCLRNLIFLCGFLWDHMRASGCLVLQHCGSGLPIRSCRQCCGVLLGGFRVCDSVEVKQVGPSELRFVHFLYCYLGECVEI
jgi:hypothetical protein